MAITSSRLLVLKNEFFGSTHLYIYVYLTVVMIIVESQWQIAGVEFNTDFDYNVQTIL